MLFYKTLRRRWLANLDWEDLMDSRRELNEKIAERRERMARKWEQRERDRAAIAAPKLEEPKK